MQPHSFGTIYIKESRHTSLYNGSLFSSIITHSLQFLSCRDCLLSQCSPPTLVFSFFYVITSLNVSVSPISLDFSTDSRIIPHPVYQSFSTIPSPFPHSAHPPSCTPSIFQNQSPLTQHTHPLIPSARTVTKHSYLLSRHYLSSSYCLSVILLAWTSLYTTASFLLILKTAWYSCILLF